MNVNEEAVSSLVVRLDIRRKVLIGAVVVILLVIQLPKNIAKVACAVWCYLSCLIKFCLCLHCYYFDSEYDTANASIQRHLCDFLLIKQNNQRTFRDSCSLQSATSRCRVQLIAVYCEKKVTSCLFTPFIIVYDTSIAHTHTRVVVIPKIFFVYNLCYAKLFIYETNLSHVRWMNELTVFAFFYFKHMINLL